MPCEELIKKFEFYKDIRIRKKLFGTFGFRGIMGDGINTEKAKRVGSALATYIGERKSIAIGKDTRVSSDILEDALVEGIINHGCDALRLGITIPSILSMKIKNQAEAGIMITASHNPAEYNGLKCFNKRGIGFSPEEDIALEKLYFGELKNSIKKGKIKDDNDANNRYISYAVQFIKRFSFQKQMKKQMKIVVDGGGGSGSFVTPEILERLGHKVVRFNCEFDGMFSKRNPEPIDCNLDKLKILVKEENADMGIAHDGDGDRTAFVDRDGKFVQGDVSAAIIADHMMEDIKDKDKVIKDKAKKIAVTVAFSNIIENIAENHHADIIYTPVGEPYLAEAKIICGATLGLEEHGSVLFEYSREGPILAGIMAAIMSKEEKTLSELVASYPKYCQIKDAKSFNKDVDIQKVLYNLKQEIPQNYIRIMEIDGLRVDYPDGWFLIRTSGTEPKVRIFSEGKTEEMAKRLNRIVMGRLEKVNENII